MEYREVFNDGTNIKARIFNFIKAERNDVESVIKFKIDLIELKSRKIIRLEKEYSDEVSSGIFASENQSLLMRKLKELRADVSYLKLEVNKLINEYVDKCNKMTWFDENNDRFDD